MEIGKVLSVNSHARIEHIEIDSASLNEGFEKLAGHLKSEKLTWPQILASAFDGSKTRMMLTADSESLDSLIRSLKGSFRQHRGTLSSVSLTCFGGVSSELPNKALQVLTAAGIKADKFVLTPHSVTLIIPTESREAAVKALHTLV